jgi:hypothetical protein
VALPCACSPSAQDIEDVQVAVFVHQIDLFLPPRDFDVAPTACLGVTAKEEAGRRDASATALRRVAARRAALPASACSLLASGQVVVDDGTPGALFMAGPIRWQGRREAHVMARHHVTLARQGQAVYRVVKEGQDWKVLGAILQYVPS